MSQTHRDFGVLSSEVDNTTEADAFARIQEMQALMKAMFRLTSHKHSKFVQVQLDLVKATWTLMVCQKDLANLGADASEVCAADVNRKAVLALEKARKDAQKLMKSLEDIVATSAPTEVLPGITIPEEGEFNVFSLDLETAFFTLHMDKITANHFASELATDTVAFYCAQFIQQIEEGQSPLLEHARLGMEETSWKKALAEDPSEKDVRDASTCLVKVGGRALRDCLEKYSKDRTGAIVHTSVPKSRFCLFTLVPMPVYAVAFCFPILSTTDCRSSCCWLSIL